MSDTLCLRCGEPLKQLPQKRAKKFCDSTCRSVYWIKEDRRKKRELKLAEQEKSN